MTGNNTRLISNTYERESQEFWKMNHGSMFGFGTATIATIAIITIIVMIIGVAALSLTNKFSKPASSESNNLLRSGEDKPGIELTDCSTEDVSLTERQKQEV